MPRDKRFICKTGITDIEYECHLREFHFDTAYQRYKWLFVFVFAFWKCIVISIAKIIWGQIIKLLSRGVVTI